MSEPWDPKNPRGYTRAADMTQADRAAWFRAGKPALTKPTSQPNKTTVAMKREAQEGWDRWCRGHVANGLDVLALTIGQEIGAIEARINAKIDALEARLGELKAEREVERRAKIIDIPNWRRKSNAAA
jgi:hypothetical protein